MASAIYTPDPWRVARDRAHDFRAGDSWIVTVFSDAAQSGDKIVCEVRNRTRATARATAHLIAAAPELLHVCQNVLNALRLFGYAGRDEDSERHVAQLEAALAKAQGGAA